MLSISYKINWEIVQKSKATKYLFQLVQIRSRVGSLTSLEDVNHNICTGPIKSGWQKLQVWKIYWSYNRKQYVKKCSSLKIILFTHIIAWLTLGLEWLLLLRTFSHPKSNTHQNWFQNPYCFSNLVLHLTNNKNSRNILKK